ncbi:MAG TPA: hypothetical protein VNW99_12915 [Cytophagaceae bacterium]|nr:hypothetical protein [Cytophagaceae bacterium]
MKKLLIASCLFLTITSCEHEINSGVPETVTSSFKKKYPHASDIKWEGIHNHYQAKFTIDGQKKEVIFSPNGTVLISKSIAPNLIK